MYNQPVVVKKGGFGSALAYGVFGTLIALVVCGSGLGLYGMNILDRKSSEIITLSKGVISSLPELQEALPPVLADALNDRRDPAYRDYIDVSSRVVGDNSKQSRLVIEVTNNGSEAVSLMSVLVSLDDEDGIPLREYATYVATPLAACNEWRGPLLPGSTRRITTDLRKPVPTEATVEITELRVWNQTEAKTGDTT